MGTLNDLDYLKLAYEAARNSPDPSTQNGAVIPHEGGVLAACNEFTLGADLVPERLERPLKYSFIEHAERNVVYQAAREGVALQGRTMYVPWFACPDCARAIVQSGIKRVVGHKRMLDATPPHWKESIGHAEMILKEAGVKTEYVDGELGLEPIRFNGQQWRP